MDQEQHDDQRSGVSLTDQGRLPAGTVRCCGIPTERLLRLLRTITATVDDSSVRYGLSDGVFSTNLDTEDLATLMRIVSGERWQDYPARNEGRDDSYDGGGDLWS